MAKDDVRELGRPEQAIRERKRERKRKVDDLSEDIDDLKQKIDKAIEDVPGNSPTAKAVEDLKQVLEKFGERIDMLEEDVY